MQAPIRRIWGVSKLKISYLGVSLFIYLTSLLFWEIFIGPYILRHADDVRMIILVDLYQSFPSSRYICFHAVNWVWRALRKIVRKRTTFLEKNNTINKTISALKKKPTQSIMTRKKNYTDYGEIWSVRTIFITTAYI